MAIRRRPDIGLVETHQRIDGGVGAEGVVARKWQRGRSDEEPSQNCHRVGDVEGSIVIGIGGIFTGDDSSAEQKLQRSDGIGDIHCSIDIGIATNKEGLHRRMIEGRQSELHSRIGQSILEEVLQLAQFSVGQVHRRIEQWIVGSEVSPTIVERENIVEGRLAAIVKIGCSQADISK